MRSPGRRRAAVAALAAWAALAGPAGCRPARDAAPPTPGPASAEPIATGRSDHTLGIGGRERTYHVYVPAGLASPAPLVLVLHGGFGSGTQAERAYGWDAQAQRGRFAVVYPDGLDRAWNVVGGCCGVPGSTGVDDVAFIRAVVADVSRRVRVDAGRVYATGISNGGMLAYRLACDTDLFAAIGPVSATLLGPCPDPAPVSVIHIHGTADHNIPYGGGRGDGYAKINGPAVADVVATWRAVDGCAAPAVTTAASVTTAVATCPSGRMVELVTIAGAGHQWPGAPAGPVLEQLLGTDPPSTALDATETIWQFFTG